MRILKALCTLCFSVALSTNLLAAPKFEPQEDLSKMPYIKNLVPETPRELHKEMSHACDSIIRHIRLFNNEMSSSNNFSKALPYWNAAYQKYLVALATLSTSASVNNLEEEAKKEIDALKACFNSNFAVNETSLHNLSKYVATHPVIPPFEAFFLDNLFSDFQHTTLMEKFSGEISRALEQLKTQLKLPFVVLKEKEPKSSSKNLTVLNLNTLFFPDTLSWFYGGVSPLKERIAQIAHKIKESNADVVCLQEVFSERSSWRLYDLLKEQYSYFYFDIGHVYSNVLPDTFAYSSGLFVASKKEIRNPSFVPFEIADMQRGINRGYFSFEVWNEGSLQALVVTSHLQPFNDEKSQEIRELQMQNIVSFLEKSSLNPAYKSTPFILVGDLNVDWGTPEYSRSSIKTHFFDAYNTNRSSESLETATCTNYFNDLVRTAPQDRAGVVPHISTPDYALIYMGKEKNTDPKRWMQTKKVSFFEVSKPLSALSDHQGLLSTISLENKK